jgi:hypothetical protein
MHSLRRGCLRRRGLRWRSCFEGCLVCAFLVFLLGDSMWFALRWCDAVCTPVMRCGLHSVEASRDWPRRATHFLCFAKESKQRKATAARCPFGVPETIRQEAGSAKTRLRLKHLRFCFRFLPDCFGSSQRNFQTPTPKAKPPVPRIFAIDAIAVDPVKHRLEVRC